jgi:predicted RNA binding protein YcfA (HicA-like mRNA interferase family)
MRSRLRCEACSKVSALEGPDPVRHERTARTRGSPRSSDRVLVGCRAVGTHLRHESAPSPLVRPEAAVPSGRRPSTPPPLGVLVELGRGCTVVSTASSWLERTCISDAAWTSKTHSISRGARVSSTQVPYAKIGPSVRTHRPAASRCTTEIQRLGGTVGGTGGRSLPAISRAPGHNGGHRRSEASRLMSPRPKGQRNRPKATPATPAEPAIDEPRSTIDSTNEHRNVAKGDWRARFDELRQRRTQVRYRELKALLEEVGFTMAPKPKGSHRSFTKPGYPRIVQVPEGSGQLLVVYVDKALKAIEECADD